MCGRNADAPAKDFVLTDMDQVLRTEMNQFRIFEILKIQEFLSNGPYYTFRRRLLLLRLPLLIFKLELARIDRILVT